VAILNTSPRAPKNLGTPINSSQT